MHWIYLTLAILFDVAGTTCMKLSAGFSKLFPAVLMGVFYAVCFYFLTLALKKVDLSIAYAIWGGVGTALIATIGILWFREPMTGRTMNFFKFRFFGLFHCRSICC
jgi:small multidrug resistance pump